MASLEGCLATRLSRVDTRNASRTQGPSAGQCYWTQAPPEYRGHLRLARRSWRIPALDWQTPLTITLPAPHPIRACVITSSGWWTGVNGIVCAVEATAKPNTTIAWMNPQWTEREPGR